MAALDALGIALLAACLLLVALVARRRLLSRAGGTVEMSLRPVRGHWAFGVARFEPDRLLWFRTLSLSPRPSRELARHLLQVEQRRSPHGHEIVTFVPDAVVLECRAGDERLELALPANASLGFLAWLEAGHRSSPHLQMPPRAG